MTQKANILLNKLTAYLGLSNEPDAKERLIQFINEQKHETLLNRIKAIRRNSYFVPDYNKPKVHTDIVIQYQVNSNSYYPEYKPISSNTKMAYDRPIDFGNDMKAWKKIVSLDHKKELKAKQLVHLQTEQHKEFFNTTVAPYIMNRFMKVN